MIDLNLNGKRAVVTGASLGIGAAIVAMLAEHGAEVEFCARNAEAIDALSTNSNSASIRNEAGSLASNAGASSASGFSVRG
mgnify:CR=1 FL=1